MSKVDDLRALREAKYARDAAYGAKNPKKQATAPTAAATPTPAAKKAKPAAAGKPQAQAAEKAAAPATTQGCGHRNMMGRACTREQGHAAKSHRYS